MVKQGKVLLADTHQNMLAGVRNLLETLFDKVFMVSDEASLLKAAEKIVPDLIVADLSLPVTLEANIARRLNKTFPQIKLIVLSIHDEQAILYLSRISTPTDLARKSYPTVCSTISEKTRRRYLTVKRSDYNTRYHL
ncbi:MAG: response regulator [Desulforhopalus sp.]